MTLYEQKFRDILAEILQLDQAELDFGIYRIMNQKRKDIEAFLNNRLVPEVTKILKAQTAAGTDISAMENEVFSHLAKFFSRYYEGGDFISKRRYKDDAYAIPYSGEEVKLYWANADQYYIKTSEYFKNYSFVLPTSRRKVHFVLRDADTEQNNNKAANNMERRFQLCEEDCIAEEDGELNIFFTYELMPKTIKQDALIKDAEAKIISLSEKGKYADFAELINEKVPTEKNKERTLLMKHLQDYTAKNNFDYFIHKDLGGFLCRELDFYIKNEVMFLDDLDATHIMEHLAQVKAIKLVGEKIITFLAQLEDFQKKLWLKKKFVVGCDYCITLDRIPRTLYSEIIANDAQRNEWVRLFAIDEIKGDMMTEGYSEPLTEKFLEDNPFLVLDTKFFSAEFKHKLVGSMENVDEECNGLLINSENFQALELLQEKYREAVKCVYIDPPFNLKQNGDFMYRTDYKDSTWITLLENKIQETLKMLSNNAFLFLRCDNNGNHLVRHLLDDSFGKSRFLAELLVQRIRKNVTGQGKVSLPLANDSLFLYSNTDEYVFSNPYVKLKEIRDSYWRRVDDSSGFRNPPSRIIFGKEFFPYKHDAHFKYSQESMDRMILEKRLRVICKKCGEPHYVGKWETCPKCGCKEATPQYKVEATDKMVLDTNWMDIAGYSSKTGFPTENSEVLLDRVLEVSSSNGDLVFDYFAGSGTTLAVAMKKNRKWLGVEMDKQFYLYIMPRMKKEMISGISQCFKYIRLEQYEDTLNNLQPKNQRLEFDNENGKGDFEETYFLRYMLDTETKGDLFNLEWFKNPFAMSIKTTKDNELVDTHVDMVETFNYLIGLNVETLRYPKDGYCVVEGITHIGNERTLVIWRNCNKVSNEDLNEFFRKQAYCTTDSEFDKIYVNGDNTLPNIKTDEEHWKVVLIEEEFKKRMFE